MEKRYTMAEAAYMLNISASGLEKWITDAKMRSVVKKQRMETDMRSHYLTKAQLEQLATLHRRTLREEQDIGQRLAAVEERLARLEALMAHQGDSSTSSMEQGPSAPLQSHTEAFPQQQE